jgi:hypothetical protein
MALTSSEDPITAVLWARECVPRNMPGNTVNITAVQVSFFI